MSPKIDVRTQKDGVALFQNNNMQRATGMDKDIRRLCCAVYYYPLDGRSEACFHDHDNV